MHDLRLFHWQAIDETGDWWQGDLLAEHRQQVEMTLNGKKLVALQISMRKRYRQREWQNNRRIILMRQLATLLKAGMTLAGCLTMLSEGENHPGWRALLRQLQEQIVQGMPFACALEQWPAIFPPLFSALIQTGELTGQLESCCQRLADQQERQLRLAKRVRKALRYPLLILFVAAGVSSGMLLFVLPEFVAIYATFDAPLPAFTAAVMQFSSGLRSAGPWLLLLLAGAAVTWRCQRRHSERCRNFEQRCLLRLPVVSLLYRGNMLSQIFTTLSLTQRAGLTLSDSLKALEIALPAGIWQQVIPFMQRHIESGRPLHQAMADSRLFTTLCLQLIKVGEESGALDEMLSRLAEWHESQTHERADALAVMLEPVMMLVTGGIVGVLVIAMYLPVFNLGSALG